MDRWRTAAWTAAIVAAAGIGTALGPVVHGQSTPPRAAVVKPRAVEVFRGGSAWIGVSVRDVTDDDLAKMKLPAASGVVVEDVRRDSPAEKAGLKTGDVIVEFDGERIRSTRHLSRLVQETPGGRKVQASVMRDGQRVAVSVEPQVPERNSYFGEFEGFPDIVRNFMVPPAPPAPPAPPSAPAPPAPPAPPALRGFFDYGDFDGLIGRGTARLGASVTDLQPQLAAYFGVTDGVLVTSVTTDSVAAKAGVKAGDVITTVNGDTVTSPSDLRRRTSRLSDGDEVTIGVVRDKKTTTLKGKMEGTSAPRRSYTIL